jgi:hypothetical protein
MHTVRSPKNVTSYLRMSNESESKVEGNVRSASIANRETNVDDK